MAQIREVKDFARPADFDEARHCCVAVGRGRFLIDRDFLDVVLLGNWRVAGNGYLITTNDEGRTYLLHRMVLPVPPGWMVDHINRDRADNRSCNLRRVHPTQNNANRLRANQNGFRGIKASKHGGFEASVMFNMRRIYCGHFKTAEEAARAYDRKSVELVGDCAVTNFPLTDYEIPLVCEAQKLPVKPFKKRSWAKQKCKTDGCVKLGRGEHGLCSACWNNMKRRDQAAAEGREVKRYAPRVAEMAAHCTIDSCREEVFARNLCAHHWREIRKVEDADKPKKPRPPHPRCSVRGCVKIACNDDMCRAHYNAKHGIVTKRTGRPPKVKVTCSVCGKPHSASPKTMLCQPCYQKKYKAEHASP